MIDSKMSSAIAIRALKILKGAIIFWMHYMALRALIFFANTHVEFAAITLVLVSEAPKGTAYLTRML
jgi:hypothetical protein